MAYAVKTGGTSVAYCALSIRVGTRDEEGFPSGIAHFTEHTIFRGTTHRSSTVINSYLDRLGGELNAFTTKEEIVVHATVLKEDLSKAGGLLLDLVCCPTFPELAIETERGVVIDEILSYKDSPAEDVYDTFEEKLFGGHPLSSPILGTESSVEGITSGELLRFTSEKFVPSLMAFTIVAPLPEKKLEGVALSLIEKYYGSSSPSSPVPERKVFPPRLNFFRERVDKGNHEVNAVVGSLAPSMFDGRGAYPVILLMSILAGPASNSRLNSILREKNGWVYGVEGSYTRYADTGIAAISLGCDRSNLEKCLRAMRRVLSSICEDPLSPRALAAAKKQLLGQQAITSESGEAQCLSMGKSLISYGSVPLEGEVERKVEAVTSEQVLEAARSLFREESVSSLIFL